MKIKLTWDNVSQVLVAILGLLAINLVSADNKWGFVVGLISQPFWLITTYVHKQWPIFILSIGYAASWAIGVYVRFF